MKHRFASFIAALSLAVSFTAFSAAPGGQPNQPGDQSQAPQKPGEQTPGKSGRQPDPAKPPQQKQSDRIIIETKLVSVTVTVSDRNRRFVAGLTREDFEIYDDGVRQEIALFSDDDAPLTLGIIYDVSGSMRPLSSQALHALRGLFENSHDDDEYFVIAFNDRPKLVQDFTSLPNEILNRTVFIKSKGSTALFDATYLALDKVKKGRHPKKALLIISDGEENSSRYSYGELRKELKETDAQIYAISITESGAGVGTLESMTGATGGLTFFPREESEVTDIYTRIALMLRHQYVVGFYPTDATAESRWHKLQLMVNAPRELGKLKVFYRKGWQSSER
ncbi:MAG TPA: VWA domain-containing protein [Blastocatellia bacterium]|nr:VWA domain-containing protein [Blastocatellia bacterium]